jgi:hypothetical protein
MKYGWSANPVRNLPRTANATANGGLLRAEHSENDDHAY